MEQNRIAHAQALRDRTDAHFNCCQSVFMPFAEELGLDEEAARRIGAHFGAGMRVGSVCGALTGALMVLGMYGFSEAEARAFMEDFRQRAGFLNCADLLDASRNRGEEKKPHCDRLIRDTVSAMEALLEKKRPSPPAAAGTIRFSK